MSTKDDRSPELSRRERQIMDIVYAASEVSAADVLKALPEPPSYSTVRKLMGILVEKGCLKHRERDGKYYYQPTRTRAKAGKSAMKRVLQTFYEGSLEKAVAAMLSGREAHVSNEELESLAKLIEEAKSESR